LPMSLIIIIGIMRLAFKEMISGVRHLLGDYAFSIDRPDQRRPRGTPLAAHGLRDIHEPLVRFPAPQQLRGRDQDDAPASVAAHMDEVLLSEVLHAQLVACGDDVGDVRLSFHARAIARTPIASQGE
jgi:hypothetical protein